MRFGNYGDYLKQRWDELGAEAAIEAVRQRLGIFKESQMPWDTDEERGHHLAAEFLKAQMPIFVRIAGELHHVQGHADVGLGKKTGGNRWETVNGPIATDILVLRDLDGSDAVQLVDCFSSMGGPETKPGWNEIEPNADREFVVPPVPAGDAPDISDPQKPTGPVGSVFRIDIAPAVAELLKPLEAENAELRKRIEALEARPAAASGAELAEKYGLVSDHGTYLTAEETPAGTVTARGNSLDAWQQWTLVPVPKP
jgi:hypothetical protein